MGHSAKFEQLQWQQEKALSNEKSETNPEEESQLFTISCLIDQLFLILGKVVNTCAYIRRFNIFMSYFNTMSNEKKLK